MRKTNTIAAALLALVLMACGSNLLSSFRVALLASKPFVNNLVAQGILTQSQANGVIQDFQDGAQIAIDLKYTIDVIPKDDPNRKQKIAAEARLAAAGWRAILNRGHFNLHPRIRDAADLASAIMESIEIFYGGAAGRAGRASVGSEGELEEDIKAKIKELKAKFEK